MGLQSTWPSGLHQSYSTWLTQLEALASGAPFPALATTSLTVVAQARWLPSCGAKPLSVWPFSRVASGLHTRMHRAPCKEVRL